MRNVNVYNLIHNSLIPDARPELNVIKKEKMVYKFFKNDVMNHTECKL